MRGCEDGMCGASTCYMPHACTLRLPALLRRGHMLEGGTTLEHDVEHAKPPVSYIIEHESKAHGTIRGKGCRAKPTTQQHVPSRNTT
jgi:hypothetical protein